MFDDLIDNFDLPIGLRSCDKGEAFLDMEVVIELLEFIAVKLCIVIRCDGVGDSMLTDDVLIDKLLDLRRCNGRKCFYFNPLGEIVYSHYSVLYSTSSFGKSAD